MTITAEQADQARTILLDCLKIHHEDTIPFQEVWAKPTMDFDDVTFLNVWVIYGGEPANLDIGRLNSFNAFALQALKNAGIDAIPSISYIPEQEAERLGTPWIR